MKILIFLHGTVIMHRTAFGKSRKEIVNQVRNKDNSIYDFSSYIPIGRAAEKLRKWKRQGAAIFYLSALEEGKRLGESQIIKKEDLKIDKQILKRYRFPEGKVYHRKKGENYAQIAQKIMPDILIEDDCESIGGKEEMTITFIKPEVKKRIKSIVVKEFGGIDHLPDKLNDLLSYNDQNYFS